MACTHKRIRCTNCEFYCLDCGAKVEAPAPAPVKAEPAKAEPAKAEPAKAEPAKAEPAKTKKGAKGK